MIGANLKSKTSDPENHPPLTVTLHRFFDQDEQRD